jgi:hypothetical protein
MNEKCDQHCIFNLLWVKVRFFPRNCMEIVLPFLVDDPSTIQNPLKISHRKFGLRNRHIGIYNKRFK